MSNAPTVKFKKHTIDPESLRAINGYLVMDAETGAEYGFVWKKDLTHAVRGSVGNVLSHYSHETRWFFQVVSERGYSTVRKDGDGYDRAHAAKLLLTAVSRRIG